MINIVKNQFKILKKNYINIKNQNIFYKLTLKYKNYYKDSQIIVNIFTN